MTLTQLRAMRMQLAHRRRRILFNNDGCDALYFPRDRNATPENFLAMRTSPLAGSQVDTIAYCTISSGFSNFTHRTKIGSVLTRSASEFGIQLAKRNITQNLIDQGTDPLQLVLDFGHTHNIEVFWSMRMNDTHDVAHTPEKPYFLFPKLKYDHPEWLVGNPIKRTPYGRWSSVDYARPEIRDLAFEFIEEVCQNYNVDGVEMDFFRHLCYFKSVAYGGKASAQERSMMTDLLRRVRNMTEDVGLRRGRPILVAVRVPDSVGYDKDMGLDVERWLREGLIDMLITTGYFRLNPWEYSVELGHKYGVPVYPCLSDPRVRGESRFRRGSYAAYRGRAMNAWAAGADGLHVFNYFNPHSPLFRELGNPETMRFKSKRYFATVRDGDPDRFLAKGSKYRTVQILTPSHSKSVAPNSPLTLDVVVGEDVASARRSGHAPEVTCHVDMPGIHQTSQLRVELNGHPLTRGKLARGWIDYPVSASWLKRGVNQIEVAVKSKSHEARKKWAVVYEGNRKPSMPWTRDRGSSRTRERLVNGALLIADQGRIPGDYLYYRYAWGASPSGETLVEAKVKVLSGSSFIIISNGVAHERLGLWSDRIELWSNHSVRYEMNTTDAFHVYRLATKGEDLKVYVDGELRIDGKGLFRRRYGRRNEVAFGAANSTMVGEALWNEVKAWSDGVGCRDLVISVSWKNS